MRTFYIFKVAPHFSKIYHKNPENLYNMLEQISKINKEDYKFAYNLLNEFTDRLDVDVILKYIFSKDMESIVNITDNGIMDYYNEKTSEKTNIHVTKLQIKVKSNVNVPTVLSQLADLDDFFVCDFKNSDYFFLSDFFKKEEV